MHQELRSYIVSSPQLRLEAENSKDIENYLNFQLKTLSRNFSLKELDELVRSATIHAQGVFLWARDIVPVLKEQPPDSPISELEKVFLHMPKSLQSMYDCILQKLELAPIVEFEETRRMFEWVLFAQRPLNLDEFRFALAVGSSPGFTSLDSLDTASYLPSLAQMEEHINKLSGNLLEIWLPDKSKERAETMSLGNNIVRFMHQSVKEYLLNRSVSPEIWINPRTAQRNLARVCLATIVSPDYFARTQRVLFYATQKAIPFAKYATFNWEIHASLADVEGDRQMEPFGGPKSDDFVRWFLRRDIPCHGWMNTHPPSIRTPLAIALRHGLLSDIEFYLEALTRSDFDVLIGINLAGERAPENEGLAHCLAIAVAVGHQNAARRLIEWGADVNAVVPYNTPWIRSLTAAAENGQNKMIKLLAENGADFNYAEGNPVLAVIELKSEDLKTLQCLIDHGTDVNARGISVRKYPEYIEGTMMRHYKDEEIFDSPLQAAIHAIHQGGSESVVRLLLKNGADARDHCFYRPNIDYKLREETPLHAATQYGYTGIMRILIQLGEDVNVIAGFYGTPLHVAAFFGHEDALQLLLNNGAKIISGVGIFGSPLQAAALGGHAGVIRRLLELPETDVTDLSGCYGHALHAAAISGNEDTIRHILKAEDPTIILWNKHGEFYIEERHMQYFDWEAWMGHRWYRKTEGDISRMKKRKRERFLGYRPEPSDIGPPDIQFTDTPNERKRLRESLLVRGNEIFSTDGNLISELINSTRDLGYFVYPLRPIWKNMPATLSDSPRGLRPGAYQLASFKSPIPVLFDEDQHPTDEEKGWRLPEFFWSIIYRSVEDSNQSRAILEESDSMHNSGEGSLLKEKYKLIDSAPESV